MKSNFKVDAELANPQKLTEFIVKKTVVPLPPEAKYPFAVLSGGRVLVFWTHTESYREYWVKALNSIRNMSGGAGAGSGQLELNENNWYSSQIYMFLKREHTIFGDHASHQQEGRHE